MARASCDTKFEFARRQVTRTQVLRFAGRASKHVWLELEQTRPVFSGKWLVSTQVERRYQWQAYLQLALPQKPAPQVFPLNLLFISIQRVCLCSTQTNAGASTSRYVIALATAPADNLVTEFLPDFARHIHLHIVLAERIVDQVARINGAQ